MSENRNDELEAAWTAFLDARDGGEVYAITIALLTIAETLRSIDYGLGLIGGYLAPRVPIHRIGGAE